jgi:hypothetical protein
MKLALERNETRRAAFLLMIGQFMPEMLVFLDESSIDRRLAVRNYGYSLSGERVKTTGYLVRGQR